MTHRQKLTITGLVIGIPIMGIALFNFILDSRSLEQAIKDYPRLQNTDSISEKVSSVFYLPDSRTISSFVRVKLNSGHQLSISAIPLLKEQKKLRTVTKNGSTINKTAGNDTLMVVWENIEYSFLLLNDKN